MASNPKTKEDQQDLNERLRSLKIDRGLAATPSTKNRSPKLLLFGVSAILAVLALGYVFLFSGAKTISAGAVRVETGGASPGESVLSASGYVVAHHKIAVGAKVMGRVNWIGVEKGDTVKEGQPLYQIEKDLFQAAVDQAQGALAASQSKKLLTAIQYERAEQLMKTSAGTVTARDQALTADRAADAQTLIDQKSSRSEVAVYGFSQRPYVIHQWATDRSWVNSCRQLAVFLNDGTIHRASLRFTK